LVALRCLKRFFRGDKVVMPQCKYGYHYLFVLLGVPRTSGFSQQHLVPLPIERTGRATKPLDDPLSIDWTTTPFKSYLFIKPCCTIIRRNPDGEQTHRAVTALILQFETPTRPATIRPYAYASCNKSTAPPAHVRSGACIFI